MKKVIKINGMSCAHCRSRAEKALGAIEGVSSVRVNLAKKEAIVTSNGDVADKALTDAVAALGFEVVSVEEKRGLFA